MGTHTLSLVFTPTDTTDFKAVTATTTVTVTQVTPTITWLPNPATFVYGTALSGAQLDATASTAGSFVYTPAAGNDAHRGHPHPVARLHSYRHHRLQGRHRDHHRHRHEPRSSCTITWLPNPATFVYGTALSGAQLDATASTAGSFVYTPAAGTTLTVGTHTLSLVFTPTDTTDFKAVTATTTVTVTQATPTITWLPNPATFVYGTALSGAQLDATASTAGSFVYTPAAGTTLTVGTHTLSLVFTPTDTTDFKTVTATTTVTVTQVDVPVPSPGCPTRPPSSTGLPCPAPSLTPPPPPPAASSTPRPPGPH